MRDEISPPYTTGSVTSADGTTIGFRQLGSGPGLVLLHGAMQSAQSFMKLATALQDTFTVYIPDRRGRGLSGPHGDNYNLSRECEDLDALLTHTGARRVFGLSSGAVITLTAATRLPTIQKIALYEPPLITARSSPTTWVPRYARELAEGKLAAALVTVLKGTGDRSPSALIPRFVLTPILSYALRHEQPNDNDVTLATVIPTVRFDAQIVEETRGALETYRPLGPKTLLLSGSRSALFLLSALDDLHAVLPEAKRVTIHGQGHIAADNVGKPELVANALRPFFAEPVPLKV